MLLGLGPIIMGIIAIGRQDLPKVCRIDQNLQIKIPPTGYVGLIYYAVPLWLLQVTVPLRVL